MLAVSSLAEKSDPVSSRSNVRASSSRETTVTTTIAVSHTLLGKLIEKEALFDISALS